MDLIIIEDNSFSLNMLSEIIDKYFENKKVIAGYSTAEAALEYLKSGHADAVICDIKLPGMNGLEFAKICTQSHPLIPIVLISAYSQFEYAQKAINTNVVSYILKPITYENLSEAFTVLENASISSMHNKCSSFPDCSTLSRIQENLRSIIYDRSQKPNPDNMSDFDLIDNKHIYIITLKENNLEQYMSSIWAHGFDRLTTTISNILYSSIANSVTFFLKYQKPFFDIAVLSSKELIKDYIFSGITPLYSLLKFPADVELFSHICNIDDCAGIVDFNINKTISYIFNGFNPDIRMPLYSDKELALLSEKIFDKAVERFGIDTVEALDINPCKFSQKVERDKIEHFVAYQTNQIGKFLSARTSSVIDRAIKFINDNYYKNISLIDVAQYVALSPKYFSRYFKEYTGYTFLAYKEQIRIKAAIKLIQNNPEIKNAVIAQQLGYENETTFCKNFKKVTGFSTAHYRIKK